MMGAASPRVVAQPLRHEARDASDRHVSKVARRHEGHVAGAADRHGACDGPERGVDAREARCDAEPVSAWRAACWRRRIDVASDAQALALLCGGAVVRLAPRVR